MCLKNNFQNTSQQTLYLLCKELVTCFILGARRTDICINWKLSRGEFSKKRPKPGLWCKNDKSFEKELSPPAFQVLTCGETTQRELINKKTFKNWNFSCKLPKMSLCLWNLQSQTASLQMDYLLKTNLIKQLQKDKLFRSIYRWIQCFEDVVLTFWRKNDDIAGESLSLKCIWHEIIIIIFWCFQFFNMYKIRFRN